MRTSSIVTTVFGRAAVVATFLLISPGVGVVQAGEPAAHRAATPTQEGAAPAPEQGAVCAIPDPELQQIALQRAMAQIRAQIAESGDRSIQMLNTRGHNYARDARPPAPPRTAPGPAAPAPPAPSAKP